MNTVGTHTIRARTVLPARRREIELQTADGLRLLGELALPLERDPVATLVTLHPLLTHGSFHEARDERFDVAAAIEFAELAQAPALVNRWLLGWSFGGLSTRV